MDYSTFTLRDLKYMGLEVTRRREKKKILSITTGKTPARFCDNARLSYSTTNRFVPCAMSKYTRFDLDASYRRYYLEAA